MPPSAHVVDDAVYHAVVVSRLPVERRMLPHHQRHRSQHAGYLRPLFAYLLSVIVEGCIPFADENGHVSRYCGNGSRARRFVRCAPYRCPLRACIRTRFPAPLRFRPLRWKALVPPATIPLLTREFYPGRPRPFGSGHRGSILPACRALRACSSRTSGCSLRPKSGRTCPLLQR